MSNAIRNFPYEVKELEPEINEELLQYFSGERDGYVQVGPKKYFFPYKYKYHAAGYYNFEARTDDIWIATFPRSGTTWTQELIWLLANNLDFEKAKNEYLTERFPFFEFPLFIHPAIKEELLIENADDPYKQKYIQALDEPGYEALRKIPLNKRRFIKTHFPFSLLPPSIMEKKSKVICVTRNPKDVAVSFYHLNRLFRTQGYHGNFEHYWDLFERGLNAWMPYFSHLEETHAHADRSNVLILKYEEMVKDLDRVILKIAKFLDVQLSENDMVKLKNHLAIDNFKENPAVNGEELKALGLITEYSKGFVRQGGKKAQTEFESNPELLKRAEAWIERNRKNMKNPIN